MRPNRAYFKTSQIGPDTNPLSESLNLGFFSYISCDTRSREPFDIAEDELYGFGDCATKCPNNGPARKGGSLASLLEIDKLKTQFFTTAGVVKAVDGVSYTVDEGETVAVATILTMVKKRDQGPDAL